MKMSFWAYLFMVLGMLVIAILLFVQNLTTTDEEDFHLGREVLKASMLDAVDRANYESSGELVMSKEKFVEVFIRRFSESVSPKGTYTISFYDISEYPPKASVIIKTNSGDLTISGEAEPTSDKAFSVDVNTLLNGILELNEKIVE